MFQHKKLRYRGGFSANLLWEDPDVTKLRFREVPARFAGPVSLDSRILIGHLQFLVREAASKNQIQNNDNNGNIWKHI